MGIFPISPVDRVGKFLSRRVFLWCRVGGCVCRKHPRSGQLSIRDCLQKPHPTYSASGNLESFDWFSCSRIQKDTRLGLFRKGDNQVSGSLPDNRITAFGQNGVDHKDVPMPLDGRTNNPSLPRCSFSFSSLAQPPPVSIRVFLWPALPPCLGGVPPANDTFHTMVRLQVIGSGAPAIGPVPLELCATSDAPSALLSTQGELLSDSVPHPRSLRCPSGTSRGAL